ncbi:MAG: methyltransferase, partial [Candidatus Cryptobacteroides sp.]
NALPGGHDVIWMSQFLDCFSDDQVVSLLERAASALAPDGRVFIMETLWDRQKWPAASFDLAQTSVYFTAMANGNSKMFSTEDLFSDIARAGLEVVNVTDGIGYGHSLVECAVK